MQRDRVNTVRNIHSEGIDLKRLAFIRQLHRNEQLFGSFSKIQENSFCFSQLELNQKDIKLLNKILTKRNQCINMDNIVQITEL